MNGNLTGESPELVFNFAPSKGEPFTMTRVEVADAMAFVRELKAKAEECAHVSDGDIYTSRPSQFKCKKCGKMYPA